MALLDGQFSYGGLVFGDGTDYHIDHAEGFEGYDTRVSDSDQPRNDGGIRGLDYVAPRLVAFTLALGAADSSTYESRWAAIRAAFLPSRSLDMPLTFKRPGQVERFVSCRPITLTRVQEYLSFDQIGRVPLAARAVDPRIYSSVQYSQNATVYATTGGGMNWPVTLWPVNYTGGMQSLLSIVNNGTAPAYPLIRFYGPLTNTCTGVTLTNRTNGSVLAINTTILTGQILTADMTAAVTGANTSVIDLSGSSRYGSWVVPRTPFSLSPGDNVITFQVTGSSTDCLCNLTWRDTWMD